MKANSLEYKFWDLVFTFWKKHTKAIHILTIVGILLLIEEVWKLLVAIPLIIVFGVNEHIKTVNEASDEN